MSKHVYNSVEELIVDNDNLMYCDDVLCCFFKKFDDYKIIKIQDMFYIVSVEHDEINVSSMTFSYKIYIKKITDQKIKDQVLREIIFD